MSENENCNRSVTFAMQPPRSRMPTNLIANVDVMALIVDKTLSRSKMVWKSEDLVAENNSKEPTFPVIMLALSSRHLYELCVASSANREEGRITKRREGLNTSRSKSDESLSRLWIDIKKDDDYVGNNHNHSSDTTHPFRILKESKNKNVRRFKTSLKSMITSIERIKWCIETFRDIGESSYLRTELQSRVAASGDVELMRITMSLLNRQNCNILSYIVMNAAVKSNKYEMVEYLHNMGVQWNTSTTWIVRSMQRIRSMQKRTGVEHCKETHKEELRILTYMWKEKCPGMSEWFHEIMHYHENIMLLSFSNSIPYILCDLDTL